MGISYPAGRLAGAALGLVTLAALSADVLAFVEGPQPKGAAIAAGLARSMVIPSLFLVFGWLASWSRPIAGLYRMALVPAMLAVFAVVVVARFGMTAPWSADGAPGIALLFSPASSVVALPGIALFLAVAPALRRVHPALLLAFGAGLALAGPASGIAALDVAAGGALFFFLGLQGAGLVERIIAAIDCERTAALVSAVVLGGIGYLSVKANVAEGALLRPLLGFAGVAILLIVIALLQPRMAATLAWVARRWLVLMIGLGVPLGLIGGHDSTHVGLTLGALGLAAAGLYGLSRLADDHASHRTVRRLFRLRQAALVPA